MKILTIVGARPQFIKAAVLSREIAKHPEISEIIVHTGQHYDSNMSDVFFEEMEIPLPKYNLSISNVGHGAMTGRMLEEIEKIMLQEKPDWVLVYGDTNSTLAGAIAAKKLNIKLIHVEGGLRNFDMSIPEEINRILTDRISNIIFCPTDEAVKNLKNEGFEHFDCKVYQTGDIMYDAALFYGQKAEKMPEIMAQIPEKYILCTIHRAGNTDNIEHLKSILSALEEINQHIKILLPLHPRTKTILEREKIRTTISIVAPVGYLEMIQLTKNCEMVITDSGGLQKEASFWGKHCIILSESTPWVELVDNGYALLAGADTQTIINSWKAFAGKTISNKSQLYGNGTCAKQIIEKLLLTK